MTVQDTRTGKQPIVAFRCDVCGKISETEWVAGRHRDPDGGMTRWCRGLPRRFYLLSADEYLDQMVKL